MKGQELTDFLADHSLNINELIDSSDWLASTKNRRCGLTDHAQEWLAMSGLSSKHPIVICIGTYLSWHLIA